MPTWCKSWVVDKQESFGPSKPLSIRRLELFSCVLLSRFIDSVQKALETEVVLEKICLWTDSQVALWWSKQVNKRWNVWVQTRAEYIRALVEPSRGYYVSTNSSPTDLSTRLNSLKSFRFNSLWWEGPSCLKQDCWKKSSDVQPEIFQGRGGFVKLGHFDFGVFSFRYS